MGLGELHQHYGGMERPLPKIAGKYEGKSLVVCGDAQGVWDDLEAFGCKSTHQRGRVEKAGWDFLVVNKLGELFPGNIEHWFSNEPNILHKYIAARRPEYQREFNGPEHTHSCNNGAKFRWPWGGHGTSGLGATLTGIGLGYDRIMICGIPLDDGPHNGEPHWRNCRFKTSEAAGNVNTGINAHWKNAILYGFDGKVKSMSGRTKEWIESLAS